MEFMIESGWLLTIYNTGIRCAASDELLLHNNDQATQQMQIDVWRGQQSTRRNVMQGSLAYPRQVHVDIRLLARIRFQQAYS